jgi:hypothetical protein
VFQAGQDGPSGSASPGPAGRREAIVHRKQDRLPIPGADWSGSESTQTLPIRGLNRRNLPRFRGALVGSRRRFERRRRLSRSPSLENALREARDHRFFIGGDDADLNLTVRGTDAGEAGRVGGLIEP